MITPEVQDPDKYIFGQKSVGLSNAIEDAKTDDIKGISFK
jgi:hypothetical protein